LAKAIAGSSQFPLAGHGEVFSLLAEIALRRRKLISVLGSAYGLGICSVEQIDCLEWQMASSNVAKLANRRDSDAAAAL
jgi:hypothetical protein